MWQANNFYSLVTMRYLTSPCRIILLLVAFQFSMTFGNVPLLLDNTKILNVTGDANVGSGWTDSYSVMDKCYCASSFDHNIGTVMVQTPMGERTVLEVCKLLGPGPGIDNRPVYNDIQCGNGPANDAGDETVCPGRTDHGKEGCKYIGPKWNFNNSSGSMSPTTTPARAMNNNFWNSFLRFLQKIRDWLIKPQQ